ncbi:hypothetical protein B0O80DRAFT_304932 [Mortierella sp. GBAus27b]|nr:hypothetical protein B0O80DRAFT_304932 [Mortierella sp. GBAus27b]
MGNTPSNAADGTHENDPAVESVTFTNNPYQRQQQHGGYMTHHRHSSSPHALPTQSSSFGPQDSIHPSTIPIAPIPVENAPRRFPYVKEQYLNESPAGSSPFGSDSSYPTVLGGDKNFHQRRQQAQQRNHLPGGGPRRRASSLISGQSYGQQHTDAFNEQMLLATAAHQDKMEQQRSQMEEGRASYRNSARISRTFEGIDPLKGLDDLQDDVADGHVPTIITWSQGGANVYVTGTFNNWKQKVRLNKSTNDFSTVLNLPPGTHRIKFIVDDEWKCSTELSAATDAEGNLVNFLEVADEEQDELEDLPINGSPEGSYTDQIPSYAMSGASTPVSTSGSDAILPLTAITDSNGNSTNGRGGGSTAPTTPTSLSSSSTSRFFGQSSAISNDPPPALPPHLEKVILNNVPSKEDNSVLPVPNHVILNHLYACSVKEGVLSISVTSRYRKKYITTLFIKPVVTD